MYGQFSAGGGGRKTKADMLACFASQVDLDEVTARKGGHNRLHFRSTNGDEHFTLHETIVATFSADRTRLTLSDGGWHTLTTKSAWEDALTAFGISGYARPSRDERNVTYIVEPNPRFDPNQQVSRWSEKPFTVKGRAETQSDVPMLRAIVDNSEGSVEVRYDGKEIRTTGGITIKATPLRVLAFLYQCDTLARATQGMITMRGYKLYQFSFSGFGYEVHPGQTARSICVGCHEFRTMDLRAITRKLASLYPDAVKPARAWVKKHKTDFGVTADAKRRGLVF